MGKTIFTDDEILMFTLYEMRGVTLRSEKLPIENFESASRARSSSSHLISDGFRKSAPANTNIKDATERKSAESRSPQISSVPQLCQA